MWQAYPSALSTFNFEGWEEVNKCAFHHGGTEAQRKRGFVYKPVCLRASVVKGISGFFDSFVSGARRAESSTRAQTMAARQTRNGLRRHPDLPRVSVSNPIEFLTGRNSTCLSKAFRTSAGAEAYCRRNLCEYRTLTIARLSHPVSSNAISTPLYAATPRVRLRFRRARKRGLLGSPAVQKPFRHGGRMTSRRGRQNTPTSALPASSLQSSIERLAPHVRSAGRSFLRWHSHSWLCTAQAASLSPRGSPKQAHRSGKTTDKRCGGVSGDPRGGRYLGTTLETVVTGVSTRRNGSTDVLQSFTPTTLSGRRAPVAGRL